MRPDRTSRTITVIAIGFLLLDGVLLILAGAWSNRTGLLVWGVFFLFAALGVGAYWRSHTRRLSELREAMQAEAAELYKLKREIDEQTK